MSVSVYERKREEQKYKRRDTETKEERQKIDKERGQKQPKRSPKIITRSK